MSRHSQSLANWQALSDQLPESCVRIASYNVHGCRGTDGRSRSSRGGSTCAGAFGLTFPPGNASRMSVRCTIDHCFRNGPVL